MVKVVSLSWGTSFCDPQNLIYISLHKQIHANPVMKYFTSYSTIAFNNFAELDVSEIFKYFEFSEEIFWWRLRHFEIKFFDKVECDQFVTSLQFEHKSVCCKTY